MNDAAGQTLYQDPVWKSLTGQESSQALGSGWLERIYIKERALVEDTHYGALETSSDYRVQYRLLTPHDQPRWVMVDVRASVGPSDQAFIGFLGTLTILPDATAGAYEVFGRIDHDGRHEAAYTPAVRNPALVEDATSTCGAPTLRKRILSAIGLSRMARRHVGVDGAFRTRVTLDMALIELAEELKRLKSSP
ncbi:PAS domain-containing protein [Methylobacterium sp. C25]|uniref:PAS domain-containing protein n=1 Tax=Methylobacterium sp. C25 TaxID=2721622 RepID=UPI001F19EDA5|nr:PAS domain-containing protein [Methylobacterium sp. C25]MCE4226606.1 PAS domain-containing protein [Methylobacterium sp. C25]